MIKTSTSNITSQQKNAGKIKELPSSLVIANILNYSKSLRIIPSKLVEDIKIILN